MTVRVTDLPGLDLPRLRAFLDEAVPGFVAGELTGEVIAGGRSNLTYTVSDGTQRFVVRRPPLGHVLATAHDMSREFRVITALYPTGFPVPETIALGTEAGVPFYVMRFVEGSVYRLPGDLAAIGPSAVHDLIIDLVANHSFLDNRRVLKPQGTYIGIGGGGVAEGGFLGPMTAALKLVVLSPFVSQKAEFFVADLNKEDMTRLANLMQAGKVTPVIDKHYPLDDAVAALRYLERGHARGKVIVTMDAATPGHSEESTSTPSP